MGRLEFGGFVEDFGVAGAGGVELRRPGSVLAHEGYPEVVAGGFLLGSVVKLECGESCGSAVGDGVDDRCCCLGGETFVLLGDQTGDGQGGAGKVDGAGGAGLGGGGDDLLKGGLLNCPSVLGVEVTFQPFMVKVLEESGTPGCAKVVGTAVTCP